MLRRDKKRERGKNGGLLTEGRLVAQYKNLTAKTGLELSRDGAGPGLSVGIDCSSP